MGSVRCGCQDLAAVFRGRGGEPAPEAVEVGAYDQQTIDRFVRDLPQVHGEMRRRRDCDVARLERARMQVDRHALGEHVTHARTAQLEQHAAATLIEDRCVRAERRTEARFDRFGRLRSQCQPMSGPRPDEGELAAGRDRWRDRWRGAEGLQGCRRGLCCLVLARNDVGQGELREFLQDQARRAITTSETSRAVVEMQCVSHGGALLPDR